MKKKKIYLLFGSFGLLMLLVTLIAADHIDSPSVANTSVDIADFFAFEGDNPDNTVFVATMQGPLTPGAVTENAIFDEDVLVEFNIDKTGDFVEDLVIQAIRRDSIMYFFGPSVVDPADAGLNSKIYVDDFVGQVEISGTDETITASANGMTFLRAREGILFISTLTNSIRWFLEMPLLKDFYLPPRPVISSLI